MGFGTGGVGLSGVFGVAALYINIAEFITQGIKMAHFAVPLNE